MDNYVFVFLFSVVPLRFLVLFSVLLVVLNVVQWKLLHVYLVFRLCSIREETCSEPYLFSIIQHYLFIIIYDFGFAFTVITSTTSLALFTLI